MRTLFVDDSGNPRGKRSAGDIGLYILAGLAVDDRNLPAVIRAAVDAKASLGGRMCLGEWEAHAHDIWNNSGQFTDKESMLSIQQRQEIFSSMVDVIARSRLDIIPVAVDRVRYGIQNTRRRPLAVGWSTMFRRFERMLDIPGGEYGLILADAGRAGDERTARAIVEKMARSRMEQTPNCAGVLDGVIYRDSRLDIMIQLADIVAYIMHRHYRKDAHFEGWFEAIKAKFDTEPTKMLV